MIAKPKSDLTGYVSGRLTVIKMVEEKYRRITQWLCKCECGNTKVLRRDNITGKNPHLSCGCLAKEALLRCATVHGATKNGSPTPEYRSWQKMIQRCTNPNGNAYHHYGGRGITVCDRWLHSFENFLVDMGERPSLSHSIDRIDTNKGYSPDNCRWATKKEQSRNTRRNIMVTYNGKTQCISAWAEELGINKKTLSDRIKRWESLEIAFNTPVNPKISKAVKDRKLKRN